MNQEEMLDRMGIEELVYQYANAADELDEQAFAACFAPGAIIDSAGLVLEGDLAGTVMHFLKKQFVFTMHNVQNRRYKIDGTQATGTTYCLASHVEEKDGVATKLDWYIRYHDELVKQNGRWLFQKRRLELLFTTTGPTQIVAQIPSQRRRS